MPRLTIREIVAPDDPAIRAAYRLLTRSFSREERVDRGEWLATLREGADGLWSDYAWHLLVAESDGDVVGLVTGTYLGDVRIGVIGYLAIAERFRSAGAGTRLRHRLRTAFARDAARLGRGHLHGIVGEVSEGNPWLRALARRPQVILLDLPYYQPSLRADDAPSPFVLYYESMLGPRSYLAAAEVRRILFAMWRRAYRIPRPTARPAFRKMMRALEGRRRIGRRLPPAPTRTST
jgi:hypothetical protein